MVLQKTWIEEKKWKTLKDRLPGRYVWGIQFAKRRSGRAS